MKKLITILMAAAMLLSVCALTGCGSQPAEEPAEEATETTEPAEPATDIPEKEASVSLSSTELKPDAPFTKIPGSMAEHIPAYTGEPYVVLNDNQPEFDEDFITTDSYEFYSELDGLGRCGVTYACLGVDLMPTESRGSISSAAALSASMACEGVIAR